MHALQSQPETATAHLDECFLMLGRPDISFDIFEDHPKTDNRGDLQLAPFGVSYVPVVYISCCFCRHCQHYSGCDMLFEPQSVTTCSNLGPIGKKIDAKCLPWSAGLWGPHGAYGCS